MEKQPYTPSKKLNKTSTMKPGTICGKLQTNDINHMSQVALGCGDTYVGF